MTSPGKYLSERWAGPFNDKRAQAQSRNKKKPEREPPRPVTFATAPRAPWQLILKLTAGGSKIGILPDQVP